MLYSHDGVGLGHFRRNLTLAKAIITASPESSVLLGCAAEGLEGFALPIGVDLVRMPGLRKMDNDRYVSLHLNMRLMEVLDLRASLLATAVEHFQPHVLLADKHPLGVGGELGPALEALARSGGHTVLGLRDVLDDADRVLREWQAGGLGREVARRYERVLVYGSPDVLDPIVPGLLPDSVVDRVRYCGYVIDPVPRDDPAGDLPERDGRPLALATVGGGEDGAPLLSAFIRASEGASWQGVIVGGPQMSEHRWRALEAEAADVGVVCVRAVHLIQRWFTLVDAIICMGGYNTLLEAVSSNTPTVCVPRSHPRVEQLIRARAFAARGLLHLVEPDAVTPLTLAQAIGAALDTPREAMASRAVGILDLGGAARAAVHLLDLAGDAAPRSLVVSRSGSR